MVLGNTTRGIRPLTVSEGESVGMAVARTVLLRYVLLAIVITPNGVRLPPARRDRLDGFILYAANSPRECRARHGGKCTNA